MSEVLFCILWQLGMFLISIALGIYFYCSHGKASRFIAGFNSKCREEQKKYDEDRICKDYGRKMCLMSLVFLAGFFIDLKWAGVGVWVSSVGLILVIFLHLFSVNSNFENKYRK